MADMESSESFDDELLSAYVDGELDEDQRAQVEERLRDDPRGKQLVDELRDLSATLQALPREQVGSDLRAGVMQQIEAKVISPSSREDRGSGMRRWAWAAMAIAATLLLSVY
jgi:anti-sigma factor RsiW